MSSDGCGSREQNLEWSETGALSSIYSMQVRIILMMMMMMMMTLYSMQVRMVTTIRMMMTSLYIMISITEMMIRVDVLTTKTEPLIRKSPAPGREFVLFTSSR